jgi:hypothetical protein
MGCALLSVVFRLRSELVAATFSLSSNFVLFSSRVCSPQRKGRIAQNAPSANVHASSSIPNGGIIRLEILI